jgi:hypothetical protein
VWFVVLDFGTSADSYVDTSYVRHCPHAGEKNHFRTSAPP